MQVTITYKDENFIVEVGTLVVTIKKGEFNMGGLKYENKVSDDCPTLITGFRDDIVVLEKRKTSWTIYPPQLRPPVTVREGECAEYGKAVCSVSSGVFTLTLK